MPLQLAVPGLADEVVAEAVVGFLGDEREPVALVDAAGGGEHVVGPQRDRLVTGVPCGCEALVDQAGAQAQAACFRVDEQQAQLRGPVVLAYAEDAAGPDPVDLRDPGRLRTGSLPLAVVGDDS